MMVLHIVHAEDQERAGEASLSLTQTSEIAIWLWMDLRSIAR